MTTASLTLQQRHFDELTALLNRPDGTEHAAYLLCGQAAVGEDPWDRRAHRKLLSYEVVPIPESEFVSASGTHVTWTTDSFVHQLRRAQHEGLVVGIAHCHPGGPAVFSKQDDTNEADLWTLARNRNGVATSVLSLLLGAGGELAGRLWLGPMQPEPLRMIRVLGERLELRYPGRGRGAAPEAFHRQALAFGDALCHDLAKLRVGVVGCGATGSATALLLARLGIGQLALFDDDVVEATNLNRLHGARRADADAMAPKVAAVAKTITELGLGTRVLPCRGWVGGPQFRDALLSCDVIFGCTDDHDGRTMLNRLAAFYLVPVIDMGLAIEVSKDTPPRVLALDGRITVLAPGHTCLMCRGVIDPVTARDEALRRADPAEYERRKREAYVTGEGNPAPAVVTFTTEVAAMAVEELVARIQGFRPPVANRVRKFYLLEDKRPGASPASHCQVCGSPVNWGRGDVDPFLDRVG